MTKPNNWLPCKRDFRWEKLGTTSGFTMVELLVASLLASIVLGGVLLLIANSSRVSRIHTESVQMDESARLAVELLRNEFMHAGYFGAAFHRQHINFSALTSLKPKCGLMRWSANSSHAVSGITPGELTASGCVESRGYVPGTDSLLIWGAATEAVAADASTEGGTYLVTDSWGGYVTIPTRAAEIEPESRQQINEFGPRLYFLRPWALLDHEKLKDVAGVAGNIPTLVRKRLRGQRIVTEPLVPFIEVLRLEFSSDPEWFLQPDGGNFQFVEDIEDWGKVLAVKISLLVRSENPVRPISRSQRYELGGRVYRFGDAYARKVYSHSVGLRNAGTPVVL